MAKLFSKISPEEMANSPSLTLNIEGTNNLPSLSDDGISFKLNQMEDSKKKSTTKRNSSKSAASSVANAVTGTISDGGQRDEMLTTNKPYETKYNETTSMLKAAIGQLDGLLIDTMGDSASIRQSRTLKRKYDLLSLLNSNASNIIGNKITAIREINNTISKCNDLELKRMKELALSNSADNSDKKMMDLYNAFITMPGQTGAANPLQNISNAMTMGNVVTGTVIGEDNAGYQDYLNNMNPAQRLNMYESNPNIKQVVVYNQQDGSRYFEVMDLSTGEVIPGVDKHDSMFLEGVTLDLENKIARNIDLGESYPIVVVGEPVMNMY